MITRDQILAWLARSAEEMERNRTLLSELDTAIGDGDHGNNMARGFRKVAERLPEWKTTDIGAILKGVGMTLLSTVGGASGPLYGSFFLKAAEGASGKEAIDWTELGGLLRGGVAAVMARGKAAIGDKTLVDALLPAAERFQEALHASIAPIEALRAAVGRAEDGMRAVTPLAARKGRASYLGERSKDHQDPGATSACLLLRALLDVLDDGAGSSASRASSTGGAGSSAARSGASGGRGCDSPAQPDSRGG